MQITALKGFHLSLQQARLWPFQQESQAYRVQCTIQLNGELNTSVLLSALQGILRWHAILRTAFYRMPGMDVPLQIVDDDAKVTCPVVGLEGLSRKTQTALLDDYFSVLLDETFDLTQSALIRMSLFHLVPHSSILLLSFPALCADDTTLSTFVATLSDVYGALLSGKQPVFEALQYADIAAWQDDLLQDEEAEEPRQYWREAIELSHLETQSLPLLKEGQRAPVESFLPLAIDIPLEQGLLAQMQALSAAYGVSLEAYLFTCWQAVLWHLSDDSDFIIGIGCNGRIVEELNDALGLYTRYVPVKNNLAANLPFDQALVLVSSQLSQVTENQVYFTWEDRDTTQSAEALHFFPICFDYTCWLTQTGSGQLMMSLDRYFGCTERFHLKLTCLQIDTTLRPMLYYDSAYYDSEQIQSIILALQTVMLESVVQVQRTIGRLSLLNQETQEQVLQACRAPALTLPTALLHQLFETQALLRPQQLAAISREEQLTYEELNIRANRLAYVLRQRGIGPNILVGLCVSRSTSMLVSLLAILKAGGAYVPLDVASPPSRLAYQLQDVQAYVLLTEEELLAQFSEWCGEVLCLESLHEEIMLAPHTDLLTLSKPEDLAYVIYTSGSTGQPKGVLISQQNVISYTLAACKVLKNVPGWHYATVSTLAADLGNTAIFCALSSGGCVQILDHETITSGDAFSRWNAHYPIDVLKIVPSHLSALLVNEQAILPRQALVLGGEAFPLDLLTRLRTLQASCRVYNHYGPTETTIGVLVNALGVLEPDVASATTPGSAIDAVSLGQPMANMEAYVLGRGYQLMPVGATGELYIGGTGVASGYVHQPELTAERFVPHPFSKHAGARLYRTGDLARFTHAGLIDFMGRLDTQIKLRGYRIEPGEIEAALRRHSNVWEAVVVLHKALPGDPQLVGYVVARTQPVPTEESLREFLRAYVPEYMLPSQFIALDAIPLTTNGKVDRKNLPAPGLRQKDLSIPLVYPRSPIEEILLEIWRDLLSVSEIGIHHNFFALGGHSLLATQLVARVRAALQVELLLRSLFEAPTIAQLAQKIEHDRSGDQKIVRPPLLPVARDTPIPLSFAQQRLWFLYQLEPESTAYLLPRAWHFRGPLDGVVLERSVVELVQRHEILRTSFRRHANLPTQVIHPAAYFYLPRIDLRGLAPETRKQVVQSLFSQEAQRPCDLEKGAALRTALLLLAAQEHVLLLTMHHIISDAWSNSVFEREMNQLYQAFLAGQPSPLAPLPVQYADFSIWQREWLQGEALQQQLVYWRHQLKRVPAVVLPFDRTRPVVQTLRGALQSLHLSPDLLQELQKLGQREGATLFMVLLAAFQALLARMIGQEDISVGTPIANRIDSQLEGLIGFFINTLVMRTDLSANPSFLALLARVREVALDAYAHQDVPFELLVEDLQPERNLGQTPFFQVVFSVQQQFETERDGVAGLQQSILETDHTTSKFDLTFNLLSDSRGLHCFLEYSTDLFDASTISRMLEHWQILLEGLISNPQARLADLPLLSAAERQNELFVWNANQTSYPRTYCVHDIFADYALVSPDAIALVSGDDHITYGMLNHRANLLAHYLQAAGVGAETMVAVCLERSIELLVSILAILKAGGCFVPLDVSYPHERLSFILADVAPRVLLTHSSLALQLPETQVPIIYLNAIWNEVAQQVVGNLLIETSPQQLAYVMYTSGSTGQPKGVAVTHQNIVRLVKQTNYAHFAADEIFLLFAPISFDASTFEIWGALLNGARLVLYPPKMSSLEELGEMLCRYQITTLWLTAGLFHQMVDTQLASLSSLRQLLAGGDVLSVWHVRQALQKLKHGTVINGYGPTEGTTFTCCYPMVHAEQVGESVLIGRPIANTQVYVLDAWYNPVPIGAIGELYIGGDGLARGYLNRSELTAERFVPHPFSEESGARLYRTGDMVRYHVDGTLEFLDRRDTQIKVRGFRVELGEVEAVLNELPSVQQCVVLAQEDPHGDKYLVAYVVSAVSSGQLTHNLRPLVQQRLPEYMVPTFFVSLQALPLNSNGKVDRHALMVSAGMLEEDEKDLIAPRTPIEELLTELWCDVLQRKRIGVFDDFFALGGHSLLATRLVARMQAVLNISIPLLRLFEAPTIAGLAQKLEQELSRGHRHEVSALLPASRAQELPLSFAQQRLWFLYQFDPFSTAYMVPDVRRLLGVLNEQALEKSLDELIRRHESLRTTFQTRAGAAIQIINPAAHFCLPVIDLQGLNAEIKLDQTRHLASLERNRPFDLEQGPLLRVRLLRLNQEEHVLLLTMHHIIADGWSMQVLVRDITRLYRAFVCGQPSPLSPLPVQYADYALWQRQWLQGEVLAEQLHYWKEQLQEASALKLPADYPRPPRQTYRGASESVFLSIALRDQLLTLSQSENVTLFMLLLAAFQVLLLHYTGQTDISVGTPIANRTRAEVEDVIGFFVNTLVLRTDLSGNPTFVELLARVREVTLGAYTHQDVPFESLVEELQPERDLSRPPLFQVMFGVQQETDKDEQSLEGLAVSSLGTTHTTTKFDITFNVVSTAQGLICSVEYSTDLFAVETIQDLLQHWEFLLTELLRSPEQHVQQLSLLSADQRQAVLALASGSAEEPWSIQDNWTAVVSAQVRAHPDAIAVVDEAQCVSYAYLESRANQLAHGLRTLGVGPEVLVGVWAQRRLGSLISLLAILKAGGGYLPLDSDYPQARLEHLLQETEVRLVLSDEPAPNWVHAAGRRVLVEPHAGTWVQRFSVQEPSWEVHPEQVAYVIYTSGSTGGPKGVMVSQRGISNLGREQGRAFGIGPQSRVLQFASWSFDASIAEIVVTLQAGGCVFLASSQALLPGAALQEQVRRWGITTVTLPPSVLRVQAEESLPTVETLIVAGEACSSEVVARWAVGRQMFNAYGPTETTVCASLQRCAEAEGRPGIGRPLGQMQTYVLDAQMQPVPLGVEGELYIGGVGVARGYLGRGDITGERFVPNPYAGRGARFYRTGDRVKWARNGTLSYEGRTDGQVKVRGYRIELGEIEEVLLEYEGVREAVVVVQDGDRVVGYVGGASDAKEGIQAYLKERLPGYLVPGQIVWRESLPHLPNGKLDRKKVKQEGNKPDEEMRDEEDGARTEREKVVEEVWCEVLGDEQIGIHENFFDLGGHSLLATQIVARLEAIYQIELPLKSVFEAPTIALLAAHIDDQLQAVRRSHVPALVPVMRMQAPPLSFAQQRLWFLDQLEPGSTAYLLPMVRQLHGPVHLWALEHSFLGLLQRHEVLRTTFAWREHNPVQVIQEVEHYRIPVVDLRGIEQSKRAALAGSLVREERQKPFDLSQGPLVRVLLLRVESEEHLLLVTLHHIISDGWSNGLLWREAIERYQGEIEGQPVQLPPLPIQYADYAHWQREWLQGEVLEAQLRYWREQLRGGTVLELPTDFPRPTMQTFHGAHQSVYISDALYNDLLELSRKQDVTLFMLLLAAFNVLLQRYSGQSDISVGTPVANRTQPELEGLIGFFINTLVLRMDLSGNPSFTDLLKQVREKALGAYDHQDVPFEQLVEMLQPARDLSRSPLFQVMFNMQQGEKTSEKGSPEEDASSSEEDSSITYNAYEQNTTKFDVTFTMTSTNQHLRCGVEYNTDLFEEETICRMIACWQILLQSIATSPHAVISDLPLLGEKEQELILRTWNHPPLELPQEPGLHDLVLAQVERTPERIAVWDEDGQLTYGALEQAARQLASVLRAHGVAQETLVALCLPHTSLSLIAMLATLLAGGAYVPLDPASPPERLEQLCARLDHPLIVTTVSLRPVLAQVAAPLLLLDEAAGAWRHASPLSSEALLDPEQLAYVIFTSGSTGVPKGVAISHRNGVHSTTARLLAYEEAVQSYLLLSPFFFDSSVAGLYWTLAQGGRLVLPGAEGLIHLERLPALLEQQQVSHLLCIPGLYEVMLEEGEPQHLQSLRQVIVAGERCPATLLQTHRRRLPQTRFANEYGPTEGTVWCSVSQYSAGSALPQDVVPIGTPIATSELYVLDETGHLVLPGVVGELYLGGPGVARGYLAEAEATAQQFVPHPFSLQAGARLYRTGDRGRYRSDGALLYEGRADGQVKVRGHRVELGEIEALIGRHELVREVVVTEGTGAGAGLVGYVVMREGQDVAQVERWAQEHLLDYMVPARWMPLEALPRTATGKVDRKHLPVPQERAPQMRRAGSGGLLEEWITQVWQEVLGREEIGRDENFFALGGHSLLATRVISRLRGQMGREIALRSLFEAPTVRGLAQRVEQVMRGVQREEPRLRRRPSGVRVPLSYGQQRLWFLEQLEPGNVAYLIPSAQRISGTLQIEALERSVQRLQQRHEILRTRFEEDGQDVWQVIAEEVSARITVIDVQGVAGTQVRRLMQEEATQPCDLRRGPLWRVWVVREGAREQTLLLTMHHSIADGGSMQVLERELLEGYEAYVQGKEPQWRALEVQYADYALWQREWLQGEVLDTQLTYWRKQLAGMTPIQLPADRPRPIVPGQRAMTLPFTISEDLSSKLVALSRQESVTLFVLFLTTFQTFLSRYCKQSDIAVGTDVANRNRVEIENVIGFFINQLVLRSRLSGSQTFREALKYVSQIALEAYAHQDVPFEKIVEALSPERSANVSPLFQVKLLFQDTAQGALATETAKELPDITITPILRPGSALKLDLMLNISRTQQGISGALIYNTDLFDAATMDLMVQRYVQFLQNICRDPDARLNVIEILTQREKEHQLMQRKEQETLALTKFKQVKPKPVSLRQETMITTRTLSPDESLPLIISPNQAQLDVATWAQNNQNFIEKELHKHGALLLRDFSVPTATEFERFAQAVCSDLYGENGEHVPVNDVGSGNLYTPVFYAPEKKLLWHNENSFNATWPMKILFYCAKTADEGGETTIVDSRKVYQRMNAQIREEFTRKQIMYIRNYSDDLGLSWQKIFRTNDRTEVEAYCKREEIDLEWKEGDRLKTWQVRPAVLQHPQTGEWIWWNQATHWHLACLDQGTRASLQNLFAAEELPRTCCYGDGSAIENEVMDEIIRVYEDAEVCFPWQIGDILLLDNMLTAHARNAFKGQRKIYVSLGDMMSLADIDRGTKK